jgi:hypothetical protein
VDGQSVDHADGVGLAEFLQFGDHLTAEVRVGEAQHDQLDRPDGHTTSPLFDQLSHPVRVERRANTVTSSS